MVTIGHWMERPSRVLMIFSKKIFEDNNFRFLSCGSSAERGAKPNLHDNDPDYSNSACL